MPSASLSGPRSNTQKRHPLAHFGKSAKKNTDRKTGDDEEIDN
jgi:hypothetical protein